MADLEQRLRTRIQTGGPITYSEFVKVALYDHLEGYYRNGKPARRDFLTSPEVHVAFGEALGLYFLHLAASLGEEVFTIVELGGGAGILGETIASTLAPGRLKRYIIVETAERIEQERIQWVKSIDELPVLDGLTIVLANEFFDALPFHRVVMLRNELKEIFVGLGDGFVDLPGQLSPSLATFLRSYPLYLNEHQTLEVAVAAQDVGPALSQKIDRGVLLIFDYGYHLEDIAFGAFFDGSMVSYRNYMMRPDVFSEIGRRDISHHVNFDHLVAILAKSGWKKGWEKTQHRFLNAIGIGDRMDGLTTAGRRAVGMLMNPDGMGSAFRVLGFSKAVDMDKTGF